MWQFRFEDLDAGTKLNLTVTADGYPPVVSNEVSVEVAEKAKALIIELEPGDLTIEGVVRDKQGNVRSGVLVSLVVYKKSGQGRYFNWEIWERNINLPGMVHKETLSTGPEGRVWK